MLDFYFDFLLLRLLACDVLALYSLNADPGLRIFHNTHKCWSDLPVSGKCYLDLENSNVMNHFEIQMWDMPCPRAQPKTVSMNLPPCMPSFANPSS